MLSNTDLQESGKLPVLNSDEEACSNAPKSLEHLAQSFQYLKKEYENLSGTTQEKIFSGQDIDPNPVTVRQFVDFLYRKYNLLLKQNSNLEKEDIKHLETLNKLNDEVYSIEKQLRQTPNENKIHLYPGLNDISYEVKCYSNKEHEILGLQLACVYLNNKSQINKATVLKKGIEQTKQDIETLKEHKENLKQQIAEKITLYDKQVDTSMCSRLSLDETQNEYMKLKRDTNGDFYTMAEKINACSDSLRDAIYKMETQQTIEL